MSFCSGSKHIEYEQTINNTSLKGLMATSTHCQGDFVLEMVVGRTYVET